jgi:hypothetical protein
MSRRGGRDTVALVGLGVFAALHVGLGREIESVVVVLVSLASLWLSLTNDNTDVVVGLLERHAAAMRYQVLFIAAHVVD